MAADPINSYDATEPKSTTKVKNGPTVIPANWDSVENMVGVGMQGLEITQTAGKTLTIDYTSMALILNTATPPLIFVDLAPTQIAMDWDTGVAMDGRETGLGTGAGWKYIWVYRDDTNGVTSGLWSAATAIGSVAEPDANFRFGRLVGAGYWDGASAFTAFLQRNSRVTFPDFTDHKVVTNGRSDVTWSGAVSLSAKVPPMATRLATVIEIVGTAAYGVSEVQLGANSSGHYRNHIFKTNIENIGDTRINSYEQELLTQNLHYYTSEASGTITANIYLAGYSLDI